MVSHASAPARAAGRLSLLVVLLSQLVGCTYPSPVAPSTGKGWGLDSTPDGFQQVGFAEFPNGLDIPDYRLQLLQNDEEGVVGIYTVQSEQACEEGPVQLRENLPGLSICMGGWQVVVASRQGDLEQVAEELSLSNDGTASIPGYGAVADQSHARVPGFGSLPISPYDTGTVAAYVLDGTGVDGVDQQSIAVGGYAAQPGDLDVLDWWFDTVAGRTDEGERATYTFPALGAADGQPVPEARLVVEVRGDWIVMVRTTDGVELTPESILDGVEVVSTEQLSSY